MRYLQPSCLYYIITNEVTSNVDMFRFQVKFVIVNQVYNTLIIVVKSQWCIVDLFKSKMSFSSQAASFKASLAKINSALIELSAVDFWRCKIQEIASSSRIVTQP